MPSVPTTRRPRSASRFLPAARRALASAWRILGNIYRDFDRYDYYTLAAALAFFFMLALFPLLIFLGSVIAYIPEPRLFEHILRLMAPFVPRQAMGIVSRVVSDILNTNRGLLSLGILGAVWIASGGFSALIAALNIAYDVQEARPFWRRRLVAFALTFLTGTMVAVALVALVLGPRFGLWLTSQVGMDPFFAIAWPYIRWAAILVFGVLSLELIYYVGPNRPQRFTQQLPGAALAVALWVLSSNAIGWYFRTFPEFNRTYGALGAMIALMLWFYVTAIAILLGAELNAELLKNRERSDAGVASSPKATPAAAARVEGPS